MADIFKTFEKYKKPGKGVPDDYVQKFGILEFFKIYFRKFWSLLKLGLIYSLMSLPMLFISGFALSYLFLPMMRSDYAGDLVFRLMFASLMLVSQMNVIGPLHAGYTYVLRNFAKEKPAFIWSDMMKYAKANLKQSLAVMLIDIAVTAVAGFAVYFYSYMNGSLGMLSTVLSALVIIVFLFYMIMHIYIYPLMVTFEYNVKQIYSTAARFAAAMIHINLPLILLVTGLIYVLFINMFVGIVLLPLAGFVTITFAENYVAYYGIKRFLLDRINSAGKSECGAK